ncbi:hypothetical protein [Paenibacillus sinopodophylli]|uniref:hypothetical protein n=1 Tax=Paenibacillus sinopodophylli TaxID=1837342 RepID=UPI00110CD4C0|nr:hypothetical protein [Paenibacillus sinopodophylli]
MISDRFVISVGAGHHQLPFIRRMAELNIPIVAFDLNPEAPGKAYCQHFKAISTWDYSEAQKWLTQLDLAYIGVGCFSYGKALVTQQRIAHFFNLVGALPEKTFLMNDNKTTLRQELKAAGVSHLMEWRASELLQCWQGIIQEDSNYMVKPTMGGSSRDIQMFNGEALIQRLDSNEIDPSAVVQSFVPGPEYRIIAIIEDDDVVFISVMQKENHPDTFCTGRLIPDHSKEAWGKRIVESLVSRFDLKRTVLKLDIIDQDERFEIIEMDFGIPGDYFESHFSLFSYDFDYIDRYIELICNKKVQRQPHEQKISNHSMCFDYLYWMDEQPSVINNRLITQKLVSMLGETALVIPNKLDGQVALKPNSNMDNVSAVLHHRPELSHSVICSYLRSALQ